MQTIEHRLATGKQSESLETMSVITGEEHESTGFVMIMFFRKAISVTEERHACHDSAYFDREFPKKT